MGFWFFNKKGTGQKPVKKHKKLKLGLALGGGGARGVAHIGVIKAFEELGIDFDFVAGTSAGSFVGAFYAAGKTSLQMEDIALSLRTKDIRTSKFFFKPSKSSAIADTIRSLLGEDKQIENLKKPFAAVAVNLKKGEEVHILSGSVALAVAGSCAVPGVFTPVVVDGMHLVDGGLQNNIPADVVRRMGADVVIAVDVNESRGKGTNSLKTLSILGFTIGLLMKHSVKTKLSFADFVLFPDVQEFSSGKLANIEEMIQRGYECVLNNYDRLGPLLSKKLSLRKKREWKRKLQDV